MRTVPILLFSWASLTLSAAETAKPIIENDRVTVWDVTAGKGQANPAGEALTIYLAGGAVHKTGDVVFEPKGTAHPQDLGSRTVVIDLKDNPVPPLANKSGYPNAFPRPGVKKRFENSRIVVWDYTWLPDRPTPMHFHDKDVVVVYFEDGSLKSTTPDGQNVVNDYSFGTIRFNKNNRTHTELLVKGKQHAIMMELK